MDRSYVRKVELIVPGNELNMEEEEEKLRRF